jgi:transposase
MAKPVFKSYPQGQAVLFPASFDEKLPEDSPARLINHVTDSLDISRVIDTYRGGGTSSYHPRVMLKVFIFRVFEQYLLVPQDRKQTSSETQGI